jgi:hypothetical protein
MKKKKKRKRAGVIFPCLPLEANEKRNSTAAEE